MKIKIILILLLTVFVFMKASSRIFYNYSFIAENDKYLLVHHWEFGEASDSVKNLDSFLKKPVNNNAYFVLINKKQGKVILKKRSSLFMYGWISPDSKHIVLLSNIDMWGDSNLVLLTVKGKLLFKTDVSSEESVLTMDEYNRFKNKYPEYTKKLLEKEAIGASYDLKTIYVNLLMYNVSKNVYLRKKLKKNHLSDCFDGIVHFNQIYFWYYQKLLIFSDYGNKILLGDPKIELVKSKNGKVIGISLLDHCKKRFTIPITKKNEDGILVPIADLSKFEIKDKR